MNFISSWTNLCFFFLWICVLNDYSFASGGKKVDIDCSSFQESAFDKLSSVITYSFTILAPTQHSVNNYNYFVNTTSDRIYNPETRYNDSSHPFKLDFEGHVHLRKSWGQLYSYNFKLDVIGKVSSSFEKPPNQPLPWATRVAVVEMAVIDTNNDHQLGYTRKNYHMLFSDARENQLEWRWQWNGSVAAKLQIGQTVDIKVHLLDPMQAIALQKHNRPRPSSVLFEPTSSSYEYNDVVFIFGEENGDQRWYANREVLESQSEYFRNFFNHYSPKEDRGKLVVEVVEFPSKVMYSLLSYLYTADVSPDPENDLRLYQAAVYYAIKNLEVFSLVNLLRNNWSKNPFLVSSEDGDVEGIPIPSQLTRFLEIMEEAQEWKDGVGKEECQLKKQKLIDAIKDISTTTGKPVGAIAVGGVVLSLFGPFGLLVFLQLVQAAVMFFN